MRRYFTSESVTEGHPDKLADRISDGVLDAVLRKDANARVAAEVMLSRNLALVAGEITCNEYIDIQKIVRESARQVGYSDTSSGFDADYATVITSVDEQSTDIAQGVDKALEFCGDDKHNQLGAGDQGVMYGYATAETPEYMPLPILLAHKLTKCLAELRKSEVLPYLKPDGKAQVTVAYENGLPVCTTAIVVSAQHVPDVTTEQIRRDLLGKLIQLEIPEKYLSKDTNIFINPTGRFVNGGPQADVGLTGRKIIVDTYGGVAPHGGGAFSGKDPTKVDRSGAYYARYVAKNIVASRVATRCQVQLAYSIGVASPVSMAVETFGTSCIPEEQVLDLILSLFDARPAAIIEQLNLRRPIYTQTSCYGHFGRVGLPWEKIDRVEEIRSALAVSI